MQVFKKGDSVRARPWRLHRSDHPPPRVWGRVGLVLGFGADHLVLVFWGEDFPCEEEYREQLEVM